MFLIQLTEWSTIITIQTFFAKRACIHASFQLRYYPSFCPHPFTAPATRPVTICFCNRKNAIAAGIIAIVSAGSARSHCR